MKYIRHNNISTTVLARNGFIVPLQSLFQASAGEPRCIAVSVAAACPAPVRMSHNIHPVNIARWIRTSRRSSAVGTPSCKPRRDGVRYQAINFDQKFGLIGEQWQPKVIAEMNDYQFKLVKLQGDFVWHDHKDTDETFIVLEGVLGSIFATVRFRCRRAKCSSSRKASNTSLMPNTRSNFC